MENPDRLPDWLPREHVGRAVPLLAQLQVAFISCVYWRNRAPWSVAWRGVADSFCLFPVRGVVRVELESGSWDLRPGQALMLPEHVRHRLTLVAPHRALEQIAFHARIANAWGLPVLSLLDTPIVTLPAGTDWHEQLRRLTCAAGLDVAAAEQRADLLIRNLLVALADAGHAFRLPAAAVDPRIAVALHAISEHFADDLSVAALAGEAGLSDVQFRKLFERATGETPRRYLAAYRVRAAARLLATSALPVKAIAHRTGFNSDHYFHRMFKTATGSTPSAYRRQHRRATGP